MKKFIWLTLILIFFPACSISKIEENSFDGIIKTILYQDTNLANVNFDGYKFYLPRGATVNNHNEYNLTIKNNDTYYYLYVDTIAYYYKTKKEHNVEKSLFYSNNLNYKDKFGYIDISKIDNKYFLEVMYNYTKIESYVREEDLYDAFTDICYILSTIKFNDSTINYRLSKQELKETMVEFDIFKSKKDSDNFLEYIEEFDKYIKEDNDNKDQDIIETEDDD